MKYKDKLNYFLLKFRKAQYEKKYQNQDLKEKKLFY